MVEHAAHNRGVAGSIPATATTSGASTRLLGAIVASGLISSGSRILVAYSGGPDSTALLHGLLELDLHVFAAHFDHALRPESSDEADQVARTCADLGVPLFMERRSSPLAAGSADAAARRARYEFLERAWAQIGTDAVALAHTADDVVEGACLHLLRGCALAGMRGMPARRGPFVRPLLRVRRADVLAYLRDRGLAWLEDPTNRDLRHARARLRHQLLPRLECDRPGIGARILAAAIRAAAAQEQLEADAKRLLGADTTDPLPIRTFSEVGPVLAGEVVRQMYLAAGGPMPGLDARHLEAVRGLAASACGSAEVHLPGGLVATRTLTQLRIEPRGCRLAPRFELDLRLCPGCQAPGALHVSPRLDLEVGARRPGLRLTPLGGRGSRKLQDLLVDAKIPRVYRDRLPLLFANGRLVCVPGIAVDVSAAASPNGLSLHVALRPPITPASLKMSSDSDL